ncbi:chromosome replication/partitioning protein (plasmid) [Borrelia coriaceae]|uniref:Putative plasmid partition protein n=1 Tax=Borrelia coriaceae ATCC 43381 TaxID=1408429 RepID=W5SX70_9SPIR|nr:chromosome replication/partitioning protein [Borrelia coriaceae]AHH11784.1 Putative plasmid partition protein [Borrelia coriaceae ATCC 43381]UPA16780.1 chromosome replication/partitioning protein [Borrelia coriaceae]
MSKKDKKEIILNDRNVGFGESSSNIKNDEKEYQNYKDRLKKITVNEINNKIEIMEILYNIREKKLYRIDGYRRFVDFLSQFVIGRSQAFLYLRLYRRVLMGELNMDEIKQIGFREAYRKIREVDVKKNRSKENLIKPLRFQLKNQNSYDFYKKNAKLTGFILDRLFLQKQDLLKEFVNEFESSRK